MPHHTTSASRRPAAPAGRFTDLYLAAIPVIDVVLNEAGNISGVRVWGLSVFQLVRGPLLLLSLALLAPALLKANTRGFRSVAAVFLYPCALVCSAVLEATDRSAVQPETVIAVVQSFYWVAVLALVLLRAERAETSRTLENGILLGGSIAATSVIAAFVLGLAANPYRSSGVDASWGWFLTMKGLTGQLLASSIVALLVGRERRARWAYAVSGGCAIASFLTYARTGLVALALGALWLLLSKRRRAFFILARDVAVIGLAAYVVLSVPRVQSAIEGNLAARWRDVLDEGMRAQGRSGSGRVTLLPDSWRAFESGDAGDIWLGRGFAGMLDAVERAGYIRIHTHNDALDVLLFGGIVGFAALLVLLATTWRRLMPPFSDWNLWRYSFALVLIWAVHAMFTGQLWLPDAMSWYALGLGAIAASARRKGLAVARALTAQAPGRTDSAAAAHRRPHHLVARSILTGPAVAAQARRGWDADLEPGSVPAPTEPDGPLDLGERLSDAVARAGEGPPLEDDLPTPRHGSRRP